MKRGRFGTAKKAAPYAGANDSVVQPNKSVEPDRGERLSQLVRIIRGVCNRRARSTLTFDAFVVNYETVF